jgi:hypothetical protein
MRTTTNVWILSGWTITGAIESILVLPRMTMNQINIEADKDRWLRAIEKNAGMVTLIAKELGINRKTVAKYRKTVEWVGEAFDEVEAKSLDEAEQTIQKAIRTSAKVAGWYLDRKGRDRGYGKEVRVKTEMTGRLIIKLPDNNRRLPSTPRPPTEEGEADGSE